MKRLGVRRGPISTAAYLRDKLIKIGAKVARHRYVTFQDG